MLYSIHNKDVWLVGIKMVACVHIIILSILNSLDQFSRMNRQEASRHVTM